MSARSETAGHCKTYYRGLAGVFVPGDPPGAGTGDTAFGPSVGGTPDALGELSDGPPDGPPDAPMEAAASSLRGSSLLWSGALPSRRCISGAVKDPRAAAACT